jgi:hypothetical protein
MKVTSKGEDDMKIKMEGCKIEIDLFDLFGELTREEQLKLVDHLALNGEVVLQVAKLLIDGHTDSGSWMGHCPKDDEEKARAMIVEHQKGLAAEVLRDVMHDRNLARADADRISDWAWKMYHAWPENETRRRPDLKMPSEYGKNVWVDKADAMKQIDVKEEKA